jgi:hypothetical protein
MQLRPVESQLLPLIYHPYYITSVGVPGGAHCLYNDGLLLHEDIAKLCEKGFSSVLTGQDEG